MYIDGMVKAVGLRSFIHRHAVAKGLKGYVRNIEGGVEVVAEGEDGAVQELIELARQGPSAAKITNVTIEEQTPTFLYKEFSVMP
jgi:acylphosphatase